MFPAFPAFASVDQTPQSARTIDVPAFAQDNFTFDPADEAPEPSMTILIGATLVALELRQSAGIELLWES
jgi:hypothetical protein